MFDKKTIINLLKKSKRNVLARILEKSWDLNITEYARDLWQHKNNFPKMEKELRDSFEKEFLRVGVSLDKAKLLSSRLEKTRVIQTATHLTATEGPVFLGIHQLALSGMPPKETYFVGTFSGVSFSNSAWSGCLNYSNRYKLDEIISRQYEGFTDLEKSEFDRSKDSSERRISLIPGNMRDKLVFQSKIPEKLANQIPYLADPIRKLSPYAEVGNEFSIWANQFCANQLRYIVKDKSIIYFDVNEVVRNYLIKVLKKSEHPLHSIFFNSKIREKVQKTFSYDIPFFSIGILNKNKFIRQAVTMRNGFLLSKNYKLKLSLENIIQELEKGTLCPSLFLVFSVLSFLNGLNCFGSFNQVEYLADFKSRWLKNDLLEKELIILSNISSLTSGICIDASGDPVFPLDIVLGLDWKLNRNITMGDFFKPLLPRMGLLN